MIPGGRKGGGSIHGPTVHVRKEGKLVYYCRYYMSAVHANSRARQLYWGGVGGSRKARRVFWGASLSYPAWDFIYVFLKIGEGSGRGEGRERKQTAFEDILCSCALNFSSYSSMCRPQCLDSLQVDSTITVQFTLHHGEAASALRLQLCQGSEDEPAPHAGAGRDHQLAGHADQLQHRPQADHKIPHGFCALYVGVCRLFLVLYTPSIIPSNSDN